MSEEAQQPATKPDRSELTKRAWARRRLKQAISDLTAWLGRRPQKSILWEDDFDRIADKDRPTDIELERGPPRPPPEADVSKVHR